MQDIVLLISAALMLSLIAVFIWVVLSAKQHAPFQAIIKPAYRARAYLFIVVAIAGIAISSATLLPWPHDANHDKVTRQIKVEAQQWLWTLSADQAKVGEVVEFVLTSKDVNHGFALYSPANKVVAQMQVMPQLTNKVRYKFTQPGKYKILCLEYCGLAHHNMTAEITVTE